MYLSRKSYPALLLIVLSIISCSQQKQTTKQTSTKTEVPADHSGARAAVPHVNIVYPPVGSKLAEVSTNFIFGNVTDPNAVLTINGNPVAVARNGGFLAYLPVPSNGIYEIVATNGAVIDSQHLQYQRYPIEIASSTLHQPTIEHYSTSKIAIISNVSDTLQTGSDAAAISPVADGERKWSLPRGARVKIVEHTGNHSNIQFSEKETGWVADSELDFHIPVENYMKILAPPKVASGSGYVDVIIPAYWSSFLVTPLPNSVTIKLYQVNLPNATPTVASTDPFVKTLTWTNDGPSIYSLNVNLSSVLWGYKAFYLADGELVVRLRKPPGVPRNNPLQGLRIVLDPGHPPGGAIGPLGLTEAEANLAEALHIKPLLERRGATVIMTRTGPNGMVSSTNQLEEIGARVKFAVDQNADLLLSCHNNAFPDGTNPFNNFGTSTYFYDPFSEELAQDLDKQIVQVTGIPDLGAHHKSLALVRPTWMPAVLTESLYMMFPDQEEKLRDPHFLDRLAEAHVQGIEQFLRARLGAQ